MDRIIDICFKHRLSHIGSCLTTYPILEHIYTTKCKDDVVILSAGHAGIAQYVILEKMYGHNAEELYLKHGIHPHRDIDNGLHVSSGSLGSAILIAVGMAFADTKKQIHCVISDGECGEGSVWEALSFIQTNNLKNIKVHVNMNGYSAYDTVDVVYLKNKLIAFLPDIIIWNTGYPDVEFMNGLKAHYHILNEKDKTELVDAIINLN